MVVGFKLSSESISSESFFLLKKTKHGLSLIISVRLSRVNNWYNGKVSGLERMVVGFKLSSESISSESFFLLKKTKHGLNLIISVRLSRVNNWYNGKVSGLEGMVVGFKSRASQFHQSRFFSLKRPNMG